MGIRVTRHGLQAYKKRDETPVYELEMMRKEQK